MKKRFLRGALVLGLTAAFAISPLHIKEIQAAPAIHYEVTETTQLTRNTYLHRNLRITSAGLVDISVLEIPLNDPYLAVSAFNSNTEIGLKQSTTRILTDNNAMAGVNGDFFGLAGTHSVPLGFELINGHMSIQNGVNRYANNSASFLVGEDGAFIDYIRPEVSLLLNGERTFYVPTVNMVTDLNWPSFLTFGYTRSTASIDARLGRSYKLVVWADTITAITHYSVDVPFNGFVVIMSPEDFYENEHLFYIGQTAEMNVSANVDLEAVNVAISGTNRILHNGQVAAAANRGQSREPRTLLGLDVTGTRLILMTIDGRGHSIGASLPEAAQYMRDFGAHNAINLDGGGSTTMAARLPGNSALSVVNTPSGGSQRSVINTIGFVNNSTMGPVTTMTINSAQRNIPVGMITPLQIFGYDEYLNRISLPLGSLDAGVMGAEMTEGGIVPANPGPVVIQATSGESFAWAGFNAIEVVELRPSVQNITGDTAISFTGIDNLGHSTSIDAAQLSYEVFPNTLGRIENGRFIAEDVGIGWVRAFTDSSSVYIAVDIYRESRQIDSLDGMRRAEFSSTPESVTGRVHFSADRSSYGHSSLRLDYNFTAGDRTQAAYVDFLDPIPVNALAYRLAVYGNESGHWLRGNILDAEGYTFVIDFARHIDFYGWRDLTAQVPAEAVHPVRLERVYAVSLFEDEDISYSLFFDNLRVYERLEGEPAALPQGTIARDPMRAQFLGDAGPGAYDMTFMGPMTFSGAYAPDDLDFFRSLAQSLLTRDSAAAFYGGSFSMHDTEIPAVSLDNSGVLAINDLHVIQLNGANGGFAATNPAQWGRLRNYLAIAAVDNIVIHTNLSPLNWRNDQEFRLFHQIMTEQLDLGRNVFVISNGGRTTDIELRDGIRYINLPTLFDGAELNTEFSILRMRFEQGDVRYSLERISS